MRWSRPTTLCASCRTYLKNNERADGTMSGPTKENDAFEVKPEIRRWRARANERAHL